VTDSIAAKISGELDEVGRHTNGVHEMATLRCPYCHQGGWIVRDGRFGKIVMCDAVHRALSRLNAEYMRDDLTTGPWDLPGYRTTHFCGFVVESFGCGTDEADVKRFWPRAASSPLLFA
jgi:hypothetical protein